MTNSLLRVVPLPRLLREGMEGRDVTGVQRALLAADSIVGHPAVRLFDSSTKRSVMHFQEAHQLESDGVYGPLTHRKLTPFFDAYGAWLMGAQSSPRTSIVAAMTLLLNNAAAVHYTQGGRRWEGIAGHMYPPVFPRYADCSSAVTWAYFTANAPDPNGLGYRAGWTGTLAQHGRRILLEQARPGDLVLYGSGWPYQHVACYVGAGRVISHGNEAGPNLLSAHYRNDLAQVRAYLP